MEYYSVIKNSEVMGFLQGNGENHVKQNKPDSQKNVLYVLLIGNVGSRSKINIQYKCKGRLFGGQQEGGVRKIIELHHIHV
jgi:hypothetical protein